MGRYYRRNVRIADALLDLCVSTAVKFLSVLKYYATTLGDGVEEKMVFGGLARVLYLVVRNAEGGEG